jgi:hypothetical protein
MNSLLQRQLNTSSSVVPHIDGFIKFGEKRDEVRLNLKSCVALVTGKWISDEVGRSCLCILFEVAL